ERTHLLGKIMLMAAHDWAVGLAAAAKLRRTSRMVTGAARTLLLVHLGACAGNLGASLGLVRALLLLGKLPAYDALQDILARIQSEDRFAELQLAGFLAGEGRDLEIHCHAPSAVVSALASALARIAAGFGASFGKSALAASRTRIHAPLVPGTAPRMRIRPRSMSVDTISTFCVVTRTAPIWPAIFLPL